MISIKKDCTTTNRNIVPNVLFHFQILSSICKFIKKMIYLTKSCIFKRHVKKTAPWTSVDAWCLMEMSNRIEIKKKNEQIAPLTCFNPISGFTNVSSNVLFFPISMSIYELYRIKSEMKWIQIESILKIAHRVISELNALAINAFIENMHQNDLTESYEV